MQADNLWLLKTEPKLYRKQNGYDPYAVWVTRLVGMHVEKRAARMLCYAHLNRSTAHIIYLDGERAEVFIEQLSHRETTEQHFHA